MGEGAAPDDADDGADGAATDSRDSPETATDSDSAEGTREVIVPLRLYKTVTVFSTLFAIVFVLGGFLLLDVATDRATAEVSEIDPVIAILGLSSLVFGAAIYAFATRFRTEEMGKSKDQADEGTDNE